MVLQVGSIGLLDADHCLHALATMLALAFTEFRFISWVFALFQGIRDVELQYTWNRQTGRASCVGQALFAGRAFRITRIVFSKVVDPLIHIRQEKGFV